MIIKIKIDEQVYEVEIEDVRKRPIIARVEGEEFEVWPEGEPAVHPAHSAFEQEYPRQSSRLDTTPQQASQVAKASSAKSNGLPPSPANSDALLVVRAPIPGVITAVNTQAGAEVTVGQQLCVLEAMKMNNSIRASRAGRIAAVHVNVGQHVRHHDILLEYAE
jgi:glutaconyl-CoA/methylmalonyl-CoA decarboxylase subunit gamma